LEREVEMANRAAARTISYERALQAIGRQVEERRLRDICILEVEGGLVLQGQAIVSTREGYQLVSKTEVLSHEDLEKLAREL
jgi:hypothetical protein